MAAEPAPPTLAEYLARLEQVHAELAERLQAMRNEAAIESGMGSEWTVEFTKRRLAQVAAEIEKVKAEVLGPEGKDGLAAETAEEAYSVGVDGADSVLGNSGAAVDFGAFEDLHTEQSRAIAQELTDGFATMYSHILRSEADRYQRIQARATIASMLAGETVSEATTRLLRDFEAEDIHGFQDKLGRNWTLENYAAMLGRTVAMKANRTANLTETAAQGFELVKVVGGIRPTTCAICQRWDEQVLSIVEGHPKYPSVATAEADGLFHPQCFHVPVPFVAETDEEIIHKYAQQVLAEIGVEGEEGDS